MKTFSEILNSEKPVLVDFSAAWCGPCKMLEPIVEQVKQNMAGKAEVLTVDVDSNSLLASVYNIRSVPTLIIFMKGEVMWRQSGVLPAEMLEAQLMQFVHKTDWPVKEEV